MSKIAVLVAFLFTLLPSSFAQDQDDQPPNPEMQRQEIVNLENETARAIQLGNGTFFRRVYSDDFVGTLSHGQIVNKAKFIDAVQSPLVKYQTVVVTDIRVRLYRETAVATCVWSLRGILDGGRSISGQMRVLHVYVNGQRGWQVVASEATLLPPDSGNLL
jgi:ketosteroid isomerase-like protein